MQYKIETPPPIFGHYSKVADDAFGDVTLATQRPVAVIPGAKYPSFGHNFVASTHSLKTLTSASFRKLLELGDTPVLNIPAGHEAVTSIVDINSRGDIAYEVMFVPQGTKLGDRITGKRGGSFVYDSVGQRAVPIDAQYELIKLTDDSIVVEKYSDRSLHALRLVDDRWEEVEYFVHSHPARIMYGSLDSYHLAIERSGITDEFSDPCLRLGSESPIRLDQPLVIQDMSEGLVVGVAAPGGDVNPGIGAYWFRGARPTPLLFSALGLDHREHMALPHDVACSSSFGIGELLQKFTVVGGVTPRTSGNLFETDLRPGSIPMVWRASAKTLSNGDPIEGESLKGAVPGDEVMRAFGATARGFILATTRNHPNGALLVPAN